MSRTAVQNEDLEKALREKVGQLLATKPQHDHATQMLDVMCNWKDDTNMRIVKLSADSDLPTVQWTARVIAVLLTNWAGVSIVCFTQKQMAKPLFEAALKYANEMRDVQTLVDRQETTLRLRSHKWVNERLLTIQTEPEQI
jgi:hypothetical protein